jgi:hypothetical protein
VVGRPLLESRKILLRKGGLKQLLGGDDLMADGQQFDAFRLYPIGAGHKEGRAAACKWIQNAPLHNVEFIEQVFYQ